MTWSITAHDPGTGAFAVAVATRAFAVGASCPFVRCGVGAVSTQSVTNRYLGPAVLDGLGRGLPPDAAIAGALAGDAGSGCGKSTPWITTVGPLPGPGTTASIGAVAWPLMASAWPETCWPARPSLLRL